MQKHFTLQLYYNIGFSHPVMLLVLVGRRNTHVFWVTYKLSSNVGKLKIIMKN